MHRKDDAGTIIVIGASGFLGRSVASRFAESRPVLRTRCRSSHDAAAIPFDMFEDDPKKLLDQRHVSVVMITARLYDPNQSKSVRERESAFRRFLQACGRVRVVMTSTDAVFEGERGHYEEWMERRPVTAYGEQMKHYEDMVMESCRDSCILRMSYLYGFSQGQLDRRLHGAKTALQRGETFQSFSDMFKSPLEVHQATEAIVRATLSGHQGPVHVAGPRLSVYEFYRQAMLALGEQADMIDEAKMPVGTGLPRDTSLHTGLMTQLTGIEARPIAQSLP